MFTEWEDKAEEGKLGNILTHFLDKHPRGVLTGQILLAWKGIVSTILTAGLAQRTEARRIVNKRLIVQCADTVTRSECFLHRMELLQAYRERFPRLLFTEIYFFYQSPQPTNDKISAPAVQMATLPASPVQLTHEKPPFHTKTTAKTVTRRATSPVQQASSPAAPYKTKKWVAQTEVDIYYPAVGLASAFLDDGTTLE